MCFRVKFSVEFSHTFFAVAPPNDEFADSEEVAAEPRSVEFAFVVPKLEFRCP